MTERRPPHHSVYVVLLNIKGKDAYYVGLTGLTPEERFKLHKHGYKAGRGMVKKYGVRLATELYAHLNPISYWEAVKKERQLAAELRGLGCDVYGGH